MDHYQLGETCTIEADLFADMNLEDSLVHMKVQSHSRMQNLLGYAINKIKAEDVKQILWTGEGVALRRTLNCAEIVKKKQKNLYMLTRQGHKRLEEHWEPIYQEAGLDRLKVNRDTDAVAVLLSKLPLNGCESEKGYLGIEDVPTKDPADQPSNTAKPKSKDIKEQTNKRHTRPRPRQRSDKSVVKNHASTNSHTPTSIKQTHSDLSVSKS